MVSVWVEGQEFGLPSGDSHMVDPLLREIIRLRAEVERLRAMHWMGTA